MTISYIDIIERCERETAYLGRTAEQADSDATRGATGDPYYSPRYIGTFQRIRIRGSDRPMMLTYIAEGARWLESRMRWAMTADGQYNETSVIWTFKKNTQHPKNTPIQDNTDTTDTTENTTSFLEGTIADILSAYVLTRWLADKLPEQAAIFSNHTDTLLQSLMKNTTTIRLPRKRFLPYIP